MDSNNTSNVTDDQELAKVLESMNQQVPGGPALPPLDPVTDTPEPVTTEEGLAFEETPAPDLSSPAVSSDDTVASTEQPADSSASSVASAHPELDSIKKDALEELRPLVDKLDLPADEKFDTLLLIIRSTDDKSLVSAAHEAARNITDEAKRAQALLDVIKEIDYFSGHGQAA